MLARLDDLAERFEEVARLLDELGLDELWDAADDERRVLIDEMLADITVHPDRLQVTIHGTPPLNVAFSEVGLKDSTSGRVGGAFVTVSTREVGAWQACLDAA